MIGDGSRARGSGSRSETHRAAGFGNRALQPHHLAALVFHVIASYLFCPTSFEHRTSPRYICSSTKRNYGPSRALQRAHSGFRHPQRSVLLVATAPPPSSTHEHAQNIIPGRGLFAKESIPASTVLDTAPVILLSDSDFNNYIQHSELLHYT